MIDATNAGTLDMWTIYGRPLDYPDHWVVRRFVVDHKGATPDNEARVCNSLEDARRAIPEGLYCIPREANDDPAIVETWL